MRDEDKIKYDRQNALGVFTGGRNDVAGASKGILLLELPGMTRFDDGQARRLSRCYRQRRLVVILCFILPRCTRCCCTTRLAAATGNSTSS